MSDQPKNFETLQVHAGYRPEKPNGSASVPIHQTTSFIFESVQYAADLFQLKKFGNIYTRIQNPTTDVFEKRVAALEGGVGALAVSSGLSAVFLAINNVAYAGDNILVSQYVYGGSYNQFRTSFKRLGIEARFFDPSKPETIEALIDDKTRCLFYETIGNPALIVPDLEKIAEAAHKHGVAVICDNTFAGAGYLVKPFEHGANVIVHAATKWIGGHGNSIGGVIVDGGNFNWGTERYPFFSGPDEAYHNIVFWDVFGADSPFGNIAYIIRARVCGLRTFGSAPSPQNSYYFIQGLETLSLRMQKTVDNALELAQWLEAHPQVESVSYPGLKSHPSYELAKKYLKHGFGGVLSFKIKGGGDAADTFIESLELLYHLANVGDTRSLVIHPANTTHDQLTLEEKIKAGAEPGRVRVSLGIENIEDIKADFEQAFAKVK